MRRGRFSKPGLVAAIIQAVICGLNILYLLYFTLISYDMDILIKSQVVPTIVNPLVRMPVGELGLFRQYCIFLREALGVTSQTTSYVSFMVFIDVLAGPALTYFIVSVGLSSAKTRSGAKSGDETGE